MMMVEASVVVAAAGAMCRAKTRQKANEPISDGKYRNA